MVQSLIVKRLLILTTSWLTLQTADALENYSVERSSLQHTPALSTKCPYIAKTGNGSTVLSFLQTEINLSQNGIAPSSLALIDEQEDLETDLTKLLKQQANHQIQEILKNEVISSQKHPILLQDLYFLLAHEYLKLFNVEKDSIKSGKYFNLYEKFKKEAGGLQSALYCLLPFNKTDIIDSVNKEKKQAERINILCDARKRMDDAENKDKFFFLSYCLYGIFLSQDLYYLPHGFEEAGKILENNFNSLTAYYQEKKEYFDGLQPETAISRSDTILEQYIKKWLGKNSAFRDDANVGAKFWEWTKKQIKTDPLSLDFLKKRFNMNSPTLSMITKIKSSASYLGDYIKTLKLSQLYLDLYNEMTTGGYPTANSYLMAAVMLDNDHGHGLFGVKLYENGFIKEALDFLQRGTLSEETMPCAEAYIPLAEIYREGKVTDKDLNESLAVLKEGKEFIETVSNAVIIWNNTKTLLESKFFPKYEVLTRQYIQEIAKSNQKMAFLNETVSLLKNRIKVVKKEMELGLRKSTAA